MTTARNRDYALVIGVARYLDKDMASLEGPPVDCQEFTDWLIYYAGVPGKNIRQITWSASALMPFPDRSDLDTAAWELLQPKDALKWREGRRLYLFAAGHCIASGNIDVDVITAEALPRRVPSFPLTKLAWRIRQSGLFREVVVFVDGCRTGNDEVSEPVLKELPVDPVKGPKTRYICAFATAFGEPAYEVEIGGKTRGVFSHVLLEGLRGAAGDGKGSVTAKSLELYLQANVPRWRPADSTQQAEVYRPKDLRIL